MERPGDCCRILIVEAQKAEFTAVCRRVEDIEGNTYRCEWSSSFDDALLSLQLNRHDVCLLGDLDEDEDDGTLNHTFQTSPQSTLTADVARSSDAAVTLIERAQAAGSNVPIIVLARWEKHQADLAVMAAGAVDYLVKKHLNGPLIERALRYAIERKRVEVQLRQREELYRTVSESASDGIITINAHSNILYINPAALQIFGYRVEELTNLSVLKLIPADLQEPHLRGMRRVLDRDAKDAGWRSTETRGLHRDGHEIPLEISFNRHDKEINAQFTAIVRDITERKRFEDALRESEARYRRIAANAPGMVYQFVIHSDGSFSFPFLSAGARDIYEAAPSEIQHNPDLILEMTHPQDRASFDESLEVVVTQLQPWKWTGRILMKSGQLKWIECASRPELQPNGDILCDGMVMDVTAHRQAEDALRQVQAELEARVAERTREVVERTHQLEASNVALESTNAALQVEIGERARIESEMRQRARQQESIAQLSQSALTGIDMPTLMNGAVGLVAATLDIEFAHFLLTTDDGAAFHLPYGVGWPPGVIGSMQNHVALRSPLAHMLRTGEPLIIDDRRQTHFEMPEMLQGHQILSDACVVIPGETHPYGILAAHSLHPHGFSRDNVNFLQSMANVIAATLKRQRIEEELQRNRGRLQAILDNTSALMYVKDLQGRYLLANARCEQLSGCSSAELIGRTDFDLCVNAYSSEITIPQQFAANDARAIEEDRPIQVEESWVTTEGLKYFVAVKFPLHDANGAIVAVGGISTDITERKRSEEVREEAHRDADRARVEADRANRAKSEFLSRMSHELRTPLNAILGFAQLLELRDLADRDAQGVGQILKAGRHLLALINEILDISRIEAGRISVAMEPVHLRQVLQEVIELVMPIATKDNIRIDPTGISRCDASIVADRQRLIQVLLNLLSNAVKYNRPGGTVSFHYEVVTDATGSDHLKLSVRDSGYGIAEENLERLFVPFDRLNADQGAIEGTGLGLALSRALIESMGGVLGVQSTLGEGSDFWLRLPLSAARAAQDAADSNQSNPRQLAPAGGTVLYIEDNLSNFMLVERVLESHADMRLISAIQGRVGLDLARQHHPDVVLLDLDLPDIHGLEVLRQLKMHPQTRDIPVLILSADATSAQIDSARRAGAADYLTKPLNIAQFLSVLEKALHHSL